MELERDKDNEHDENCVRVMVGVSEGRKYHLGHLPKKLACLVAPLLDKGIDLDATFGAVTGGYHAGVENYGATINIEL